MSHAGQSSRMVHCLVCGSKTNRFHFRVAACRACAVFFRRTINLQKEYVCQMGDQKCDLIIGDVSKTLCRYCRYEKCKKIGMKFERSLSEPRLSHRRLKEAVRIKSEASSFDSPENRGSLTPESRIYKTENTLHLDLNPVVQFVKEIIARPCFAPYPIQNVSFIEELLHIFPCFINSLKPEVPMNISNVCDQETYIKFEEKVWIELANLLVSSTLFANLDFSDKMRLYDHLRWVFRDVAVSYLTILIFGYDQNDLRIINDSETAFDMKDKGIVLKNASPTANDDFSRLWAPAIIKKVEFILKPMKELEITQLEMVYLLATILWNTQEINDLSETIPSLAKDMQQQIDQDLHNFYIKNLNLSDYSHRMSTLHRIASAAESIAKMKKEVITMMKIFNIFDVELMDFSWI